MAELHPISQQNLCSDRDSFSEAKISEELCRNLKIGVDDSDKDVENTDNGGCDDAAAEESESEEEFTFMCGGGECVSPKAAEELFSNGQIKPIFPLFNRDLVFPPGGGDNSAALYEDLPIKPPVKKVFVELNGGGESSQQPKSENDDGEWTNRKAVEASPEICKKSNSTGFSKIWRFKDLLGRSNSDGRDAYVFLNNSQSVPAAAPAPVKEKSKKKEEKVKAKKSKGKTTSLSAHEAYLKSKAKEEERRRSYLPYRPELMGFFTNANSGLTKNVHPF